MDNKLISFIDDLKVGDKFYYVNVEFFKTRKELSNVFCYELEITNVTSRTVHVKQHKICWLFDIKEKEKLSIAKIRREDLENDYAGGFKRTKEQVMFFLNEYKAFIEINAQNEDSDKPQPMDEELKAHCISVIQEGIDKIEGKYIIQ